MLAESGRQRGFPRLLSSIIIMIRARRILSLGMITGPAAAGLEVETPGDCRSSVTPSLRLLSLRLGGSESVAGLQWPATAAERAPADNQPGRRISGNNALNASQRIRGPGRGAAAQARSEASSVDSNGGPDRDPRAGQSEE